MTKLFVEEMSCNHCVGRIDTLLTGLHVEHEICLEDKTVSVAGDDSVVSNVIEELDDIGFTATKK